MSSFEQEPTLPLVDPLGTPNRSKESQNFETRSETATVGHFSAVLHSGLRVRCPHCHNHIELLPGTEFDTIKCSTCGSNFSLTSDDDPTRDTRGITQVGHFTLVERLGVGGFGAVWKAHDTELDRTVAIKIPRSEQLDKFQQDLFLREARSAAQLRHPNIVPVFEVGRDGDTLYIVSEFVRGVTLADRLTAGSLSAREAVEICAKIANALEHAHQQGVIHRDLKPGNVMLDSHEEPYLMDFGLARREANEITMTMAGQVLGTPAYMSPEQAQGEGHSADCRSDIYSLGVMLFQLLTGELPFRGILRMLIHQVIHDEPPSPRKLDATIPKDLETITLKCLEKDPGRRYQTAKELADELRRYLAGIPILSRPISRAEYGWRWCRRNPLVAGLTSAASLLLIAVATVATIGYISTKNALAAKAEAASTATQVANFLTNIFCSSDPLGWAGSDSFSFFTDTGNESDLSAKQILDRGALRIETELASQPQIQATLMDTIGNVYWSTGLYEHAVDILRKSRAIRLAMETPEPLKIADTTNSLALALHFSGHPEESEQLYRSVLDIRRNELGTSDVKTITTLQGLGLLLASTNDFSESEALLQEAVTHSRNAFGSRSPILAQSLIMLSSVHLSMGHHQEAKYSIAEAIAICAANHNENGALAARGVLFYQEGIVKCQQGDFRAGEARLREAVETLSSKLGKNHPVVAWGMFDHGRALDGLGRSEEAIQVFEKAIAMGERFLAPNHPEMVIARLSLAASYMKLGKFEIVEQMLQQAERDTWIPGEEKFVSSSRLENQGDDDDPELASNRMMQAITETYGNETAEHAICLRIKSWMFRELGRSAEAVECSQHALEIMEDKQADFSLNLWDFRCELARALLADQRPQEAIDLLEAELSISEQTAPDMTVPFRELKMAVYEVLGNAYLSIHDLEGGEKTFVRAIKFAESREAIDKSQIARGEMLLGLVLDLQGNHQEARQKVSASCNVLKGELGEQHPWTCDAVALLSKLQNDDIYSATDNSLPAIVENAR